MYYQWGKASELPRAPDLQEGPWFTELHSLGYFDKLKKNQFDNAIYTTKAQLWIEMLWGLKVTPALSTTLDASVKLRGLNQHLVKSPLLF